MTVLRQPAPKATPPAEPAPRIERTEIDGRSAWIKRPERITGRMRWQKRDPRTAFEAERRALKRLHADGLPVPAILAEGPDWFATEDAGRTLYTMTRFDTPPPEGLLRAFADAGRALARMHGRGHSHGRPSLKDICWRDGEVRFIDFETGARNRGSDTARARDVLAFFFNAISETGGLTPEIEAARRAYLDHDSSRTWPHATRLARRLGRWLAPVRPLARRMGGNREFRAIEPTLAFFREHA